MARHLMSLICKKVIVDDASKLPSYIDTLIGANYGVIKIPDTLPTFSIASAWTSDSKRAEKIAVKFVLERPSGKEEVLGIADIQLGGKQGQYGNLTVDVRNLSVDSGGKYCITISAKMGKKNLPGAEIPFTVYQTDENVEPNEALKDVTKKEQKLRK